MINLQCWLFTWNMVLAIQHGLLVDRLGRSFASSAICLCILHGIHGCMKEGLVTRFFKEKAIVRIILHNCTVYTTYHVLVSKFVHAYDAPGLRGYNAIL